MIGKTMARFGGNIQRTQGFEERQRKFEPTLRATTFDQGGLRSILVFNSATVYPLSSAKLTFDLSRFHLPSSQLVLQNIALFK